MEEEGYIDDGGQMPPGSYPPQRGMRTGLRGRWKRHGPIALHALIWIASILSGIGVVVIYSLFLSHCINSDSGGMFLVRLELGGEQVQVSYLGMCVAGKRPALTFNQDPAAVLTYFDADADSDLGRLLLAGRDLQNNITIAFVFPLAVLVLWALWHAGMAYLLRQVTSVRGNMLQPRLRIRLEWKTWNLLLFGTGLPALLVAIGSAWSVMTALQSLVSLWGNLAAQGSPVIVKGSAVETAHWVAVALLLVFGVHTARMLVEIRRVINKRGSLVTRREKTWDMSMNGMDPEMGMGPRMFPGTDMPMPEGAVM